MKILIDSKPANQQARLTGKPVNHKVLKCLPAYLRKSFSMLVLVTIVLNLAACSLLPKVKVPGMDRIVGDEGIFKDRKEEYLEAKTIPRTEIPDGMDSYIIDDLLVIPEIPGNNSVTYPDAPRPLPLLGKSDREVVIQKMQDRSWIIADVSPSQIWPRIRDYWRQAGVPVASENPTAGVMETGWFVLDGNVLTREKFKVSVATGFQDNSSEVQILHMSAPQSMPVIEQVTWPEKSMDITVAYDFLLDMSSYLADVADLYQASSVSLLAGTLSGSGKASLTTTSAGNSLLTLEADYDRSWAALRRALTRNEIEVTGEDADLGTIDVNFDPNSLNDDKEEEGPGFFKRVITLNGIFSRAEQQQSYPIRLQVLSSGKVVEILAQPGSANANESTNTASAKNQDKNKASINESIEAANILLNLLRNTIA